MVGHELHCVWDAREIPDDRARRGAITCCDECKRQYSNYRRRIRAQGKCRLCGRGRRRTSKLEPVLMQHTGVYARLGTRYLAFFAFNRRARRDSSQRGICQRNSASGQRAFCLRPDFSVEGFAQTYHAACTSGT